METARKPQLLIIDLGSQYTQLIARELLGLGYKSSIMKPGEVAACLANYKPKGIILSGGDGSVYDANAIRIPDEIFEAGCPILGVCYGMHYLAYLEDKEAVQGDSEEAKEYGPTEVALEDSPLFKNLPKMIIALESHGDAVLEAPATYKVIARSQNAIQAIEHKNKAIYGVQFHPEVKDTPEGTIILSNFLDICGCTEKDWSPQDTIAEIRQSVAEAVGEGRAALGVSGGVDSTTLAALLSGTLGDKLFCFLINTGGLRYKEQEEVEETCRQAGIKLHVIDASESFFKALSATTDAEEKRQRFKEAYLEVFARVISDNGITHVIQGTLATDLIESGHAGQAVTIKSHHNVGLAFTVPQLTPFDRLFKHEVRGLARILGLDKAISERKPFPGPGLFIRVIGTPATPELIEKVRLADALVSDILKEEGAYEDISQIIVAIPGISTVGVVGDKRSYGYPVVVRCVSSTDFMTVTGVELPSRVKKRLIGSLTQTGFNRVWFDETPKPPATTEME